MIAVISITGYHQFYLDDILLGMEQRSIDATFVNYPANVSRVEIMSSAPTSFIDAAEKCRSSVVSIRTLYKKEDSQSSGDRYSNSNGSGVIVSPNGHIVTSFHVVENATDIQVTLDDNREFKGEITGTDPSTDLALIKIEADDLKPVIYGNSDSVRVGEWVLAIGNPFRLQSTVTAGIVSAKARNINIFDRRGIESFIQTDAAVNPGNSGGALVNTAGLLVGINSAIMTYSGKYEGFSFAVPSNLVKKIVSDLRQYGAVQRGWMGVSIINVDNFRAKEESLDFVGGVYIDVVEKGGAAYDAGLKSGDIITAINGREALSVPAFMESIAQLYPGDKVSVEYYRKGTKRSADIILRNQLNSTDFVAVRKDRILVDLGFELRNLDSDEKSRIGKEGIYVVSIYKNSKIGATNMDPGYIITSVNGQLVSSVDQLIEGLRDTNDEVLLNGFYENYPGEFPYTFSLK